MSAATILAEASAAGVTVSLDGASLSIEADDRPPAAILEKLQAAKPAIVAHLQRLKDKLQLHTVELSVSGKPLATACVVCGRICTGTRPDQYRLVDPNDQAGPRVHTKCFERLEP